MIAPNDLKPGSVVRLVSGSPKMTVVSLMSRDVRTPMGSVERVVVAGLMWFSQRGELQKADISNQFLTWPAASRPRDDDADGEEA